LWCSPCFCGGGGINSAQAACNTNGTQCSSTSGSNENPTNMTFQAIGTALTDAAVYANGLNSNISGMNLIINATGAGEYAGYVKNRGEVRIVGTASTITSDNGFYIEDAASQLYLETVTFNVANDAAQLLGGVMFRTHSSTINSGSWIINSSGDNNISYHIGGSIFTSTGSTGGILNFTGSDNDFLFSSVNASSVGNYAIVSDTAGTGNNLKIESGSLISHNGNLATGAAVLFQTGGDMLLDSSIIENIGLGHGVVVGGGSNLSNFKAQKIGGNWFIETHGNNSRGIDILANGKADLKGGKIITNGNNSTGINVLPTAQNIPLVADNVQIETKGNNSKGVFLGAGTSTLTNVDIKGTGNVSMGIGVSNIGTALTMNGGSVNLTGLNDTGIDIAHGSSASVSGVNVSVINSSSTNSYSVGVRDGSYLNLNNSIIDFQGGTSNNNSAIYLEANSSLDIGGNSTVTAANNTAIRSSAPGVNTLNVTGNSTISGDVLIRAGLGSNSTLSANDGKLFGHAFTAATATTRMNLANNSIWTLRPNAAGTVLDSNISQLDLDDSHIVFDQAGNPATFQSLRIKQGALPYGFRGLNGSTITFNTLLNTGGALANQFTDRMVIHGDIDAGSTTTLISINEVAGSPGGLTSPSGNNYNNEGISIIQVSGAATEASFALAGGYVTMGSLPYQYKLHAYGPGSSKGVSDPTQTDPGLAAMGGTNNWDYRLQNEFIRTNKGWAVQVVPQVASYLTAPTALFQAGLMDVASLQNRLGEMRLAPVSEEASAGGDDERAAKMRGNFFLRGFGGDYNYRSNLDASRYGYDADIRYAAVQAGGSLFGFDNAAGQMMFGLAGTYGDLSFSPDRLDSRKTPMDVWNQPMHHGLGIMAFMLIPSCLMVASPVTFQPVVITIQPS